MPSSHDDTIAAIATPSGAGGIGVVRLSGPRSLDIVKRLFTPKIPRAALTSHRLHYGWVHHPDRREMVDEVLAVFMRGPHTYTREDVVEIHCHGSYLVVEEILAATLAAGARLAQPGEFTKRAFLNGRIDLTQAEAVLELLQARTRKGLSLALGQLQGGLQKQVEAVRQELLTARAVLEVAIDFPEEDAEILDSLSLGEQLRTGVEAPLQELMATAERGRIYREGVAVVILGRPNVGKSSLLNSLLREERAIVTPIPGTTRDTIEEIIDIRGIPVRIIDTAGIREAAESVEELGIRRAREKLAAADLALVLLDASEPLDQADCRLLESIGDKPLVLVANKIDIAAPTHLEACRRAFPGHSLVALSARTGEGLERLEQAIFAAVTEGAAAGDPDHGCVPNVRHKEALSRGLAATRRVRAGLAAGLPPDLLAIELQTALDHLGEIVGATTTEDVLDTIFHRFCIGK